MSQRLLPFLTFSLIALFLLFVSTGQARADAGATHTHVTVDGYSAELVLPSGPAQVGPNAVIIRIHSPAGQPLEHATVLVNPVAAHSLGASTHSHNDDSHSSTGHTHGDSHIETIMTEMEAGAEAGTYTSVIHFDSAGAWQVQLQFNAAAAVHAGLFVVTVAEPPRDWRILAAFAGANALIIAIAGVMKGRSSVTAKRKRAAMAADSEV